MPIPRLIEEPDPAIMALKGENVSLICKAVSNSVSNMTFLWKKNNIELTYPKDLVSLKHNPDGKSLEATSNLTLTKMEHAHAGKYQCVVSNSYGTTYSQKSSISVLVYPTFQKIPKNVTIKAGEISQSRKKD